MSRLKIKKIDDPDTDVPVHNTMDRIEAIKAEISSYTSAPHLAEVEVFDMWEDISGDS